MPKKMKSWSWTPKLDVACRPHEDLKADVAAHVKDLAVTTCSSVNHTRIDVCRQAVCFITQLPRRTIELIALATSVELDTFSKVKKAIDDIIAMSKQQQQQIDEVAKHDGSNAELCTTKTRISCVLLHQWVLDVQREDDRIDH